jgi:hypothetical protein
MLVGLHGADLSWPTGYSCCTMTSYGTSIKFTFVTSLLDRGACVNPPPQPPQPQGEPQQPTDADYHGFNGVVDYLPIPESDKQEYYRNLGRLDQVLFNIEKYIHLAFDVMKKEDVVERMFTMVS